MNSITQIAHDSIEYDVYYTPEECLKYLNNRTHFNSFALQLNRTLTALGISEDPETRAAFLRNRLNHLNLSSLSSESEREILFSIGLGSGKNNNSAKSITQTSALRKEVKDWLSGNKLPGHIRIVLICFALNLPINAQNYSYKPENTSENKCLADAPKSDTLDLTESLFIKGSRDCAFNFKNAEDIIFFYCLLNNLPFTKAIELIGQYRTANVTPIKIDSENVTQVVRNIFADCDFIDESDFLRTLCESKPYLTSFSQTAVKTFKKLKNDIQILLTDKINPRAQEMSNEDLLQAIFIRDEKSPSFRLSSLFGSKNGIAANLPNCTDLDALQNLENIQEKDRPSLKKIRKTLILFFFFAYAKKWESSNYRDAFDYYDFFEKLSTLLDECGLPCLYYADPFDWFILKCVSLIEIHYHEETSHPADASKYDSLESPTDLLSEVLALSFGEPED